MWGVAAFLYQPHFEYIPNEKFSCPNQRCPNSARMQQTPHGYRLDMDKSEVSIQHETWIKVKYRIHEKLFILIHPGIMALSGIFLG